MKWTKESVFEEAKKYINRKNFREGNKGAYNAAMKNKWIDDMPWLAIKRKIWTKEEVFEESKKYDSRNAFCIGCQSAYTRANKNGWLDEMTWLIPKLRTWNKEDVFKESKKYTGRGPFQKGSPAAYHQALKNGWLDEMIWLIPYDFKTPQKWGREKVFEESKKYSSRAEFLRGSSSAYRQALSNGWLDEMVWLISQHRTWTKEEVFEESKKYDSRNKFKVGSSSAYKIALKNEWLDEMIWLKTSDLYKSKEYCIYVYVDEEFKTAYVGLTQNKEERHKTHATGLFHNKRKHSLVYNYFSGLNKEVPFPIYLEENLNAEQARDREDYWLKQYKSKGYVMLNKGKTGKNTGSIGGYTRIWTKERVFEESKKYSTLNEFRVGCQRAYLLAHQHKWIQKMTWLVTVLTNWTKEKTFEESKKYNSRHAFKLGCNSAYNAARDNNWIDEMTWLVPQRRTWDIEKVLEESKKYSSRKEFQNKDNGGYQYALKHKLLDKMTWLVPQLKSWTKESVFEESKKYENRKTFEEGCPAAYDKAYRNGWLEEMTWLVLHKRVAPIKWTKEEVFKESRKYTSRKDFERGCQSACNKARKNGWLDEMTWLVSYNRRVPLKWSKEQVFEESKKYNSRSAFSNGSKGAYAIALKNRWLDEMVWLLPQHETWTKERVFKESKKYDNRTDFANSCSSAYNNARANGWLDEMLWLLPQYNKPLKWSKEKVFEESRKYNSRVNFQKGSNSAYNVALKNKWLDEMPWLLFKHKSWTKDDVFEESRKYNSRSAFKYGCNHIYQKARKNGWLDEMTWLKSKK